MRRTSRPIRWLHPWLALAYLLGAACTQRTPHSSAGPYAVVTKSDPTSFFYQPHQEFWFRSDAEAGRGELLGVCGSPRLIRVDMKLPGDPSCFALAPDGSSIVYLHRPRLAGVEPSAKKKPAGLYRHTAEGGDRLLYREAEVGQVWTARPVEPGAMRVMRHPAAVMENGERCSRYLVLWATGEVREESACDPS